MLKLQCTSCSKTLGVKASLAGKQIKCPGCGTINTVPDQEPEPVESPPESLPVRTAPTIRVTATKKAATKPTGPRTAGSPARRRKKNRVNPGWLLLCGSLLALAVVGVAAFVLLGGRSEVQIASQSEPDQQDALAAAGSAPTDLADDITGPPQDSAADPALGGAEADETKLDETELIGELPELWAGRGSDAPAGTQDLAAMPLDGSAPEASPRDQPTPDAEQPPATAEPDELVSELPQVEFDDPQPAATGVDDLPAATLGELTEDEHRQLADWYSNRQLFSVKEYPRLRRIFADRFARLHAAEIQAAWAEDEQAMRDWLEEHRSIREELFLAIDPEVDDVVRALQIFKSLKDAYPEQLAAYANLAIAIAVTWDNPRHIYETTGHQRRAKAVLPEGLTDEIGNFEYFLKTEAVMQGRGQWLPWEFLVHVVNHRTPLDERAWALQNYLANRVMFGKCYQDVPYDTMMLETQSQQARMNDQAYTLANLRTYGGVCALQADFASRVGQSLGVPAAYVGGESVYGDLHAWVMWVEIKTVTPKSIVFTLESHGRYRGDRYYVGTLRDPKSGQSITDRQLELRLHTVGSGPLAKRHADLVMAAYPLLTEQLDLGTSARFDYLRRAVELCPGHEPAWLALTELATVDEVKQKHRKQMTRVLDQLFRTFANFPDFTWTIFDDLIQFEDRLKERIKLYERLTILYQAAQRPDLACEARLRLTDLLVEDGRELEAVDGLAATITVFVDEGRYVPRMLDRIELICQNVEGAAPHLLRFYQSFLPRIPQMRGERPSRYCMETYERAIALFRQHGEPALAQAYEAQLAQIRAGKGRR